MKVYVVKNNKGQYMTETMDFINSLWQAELFDDLELACCYTPNDCNVIECALMTPTEFQDYTKQVRKEVYEELKNKILYCSERILKDGYYYNGKELDEILDQIQGEDK